MRRLGLDIGTNSIGWCLIEDDTAIVDIGVRIFSDGREPPKSGPVGKPLAEARRTARGGRKRRDRYIRRRSAFLDALVDLGLMPADADEAKLIAECQFDKWRTPEGKLPQHLLYELRAAALDQRLELFEIGRALFHLNLRRGFKSNRKAERKDKDSKPGLIENGRNALDAAMQTAGARTLGEFLAMRLREGKAARVRLNSENQDYDFYPQRAHYKYEFDRIWAEQAKHHPNVLTDAGYGKLDRILFYQRELKESVVGKCTFAGLGLVPDDDLRLPKWHPLFQERRLYEELNHLRITAPGAHDRPLTLDQRDKLVRILKVKKEPAFKTLAKEIGLQPGEDFNKHSANRTTILGDVIYATMANKKLFGNGWPNFTSERQQQILDRLLNESDPDILRRFLREECGLDDERIALAEKASNEFPSGYGRLGETATRAVLAELKRYLDEDGKVITYDAAVKRGLDIHHSDRRTGEDIDRLPYYGELLTHEIAPAPLAQDEDEKRWGKITNPTVHIGLRQLQKLVNAIIVAHGLPDEIVLELARELKQNEKERERESKRIRDNTVAAKKRSEKLIECEQKDNGRNRMKLRLWEELAPDSFLNRQCPYCAKAISPTMLFNGEVDIDHILPYSRTLDDSIANKVVAHRSCNRLKGQNTPWQAWGDGKDPSRWADITAQLSHLHRSKQWRFAPDAMERFERDRDFLDRQLNDTQYLSKMARTYLTSLYPDRGEGSNHVYVVTGSMTAMLRRLWALEGRIGPDGFVDEDQDDAAKNRNDHRHHAVDAFVVAMISRPLLQAIANAAGKAEREDVPRMFDGLPEPWPGYRRDLRTALAHITVSHKPDHGRKGQPAPDRDVTSGRLHKDTAFGLVKDPTAADGLKRKGDLNVVVHRVPLNSLKVADISDPERIPDRELREALRTATLGKEGKAFDDALCRFAREGANKLDRNGQPLFQSIRRIRVIGEKAGAPALSVLTVKDSTGRPFKAYKGGSNDRFDVWQMPDGKWKHDVVQTFEANQSKQTDRRPHPAAKKILSLKQRDIIAIERDGARQLMVVQQIWPTQISIVAHMEAGNFDKRNDDKTDAFKFFSPTAGGLKKLKARQVRIDPLGRIFDPGPR